jgi:5-carboxymethyl-2-hydroxymuconate isomerase
MPHINVEYSKDLKGKLNRKALAKALHAAAVEIADAKIENCKTRFLERDELYLGDMQKEASMLHIDIAVFASRTAEQKSKLGEKALMLAQQHLVETARKVFVSVHISDLNPKTYFAAVQ